MGVGVEARRLAAATILTRHAPHARVPAMTTAAAQPLPGTWIFPQS